MKNTKGLIPFKPGQSGNPAGRTKTWVGVAKEMGWKKSEVVDCARSLLAMSHAEMDKHMNNPDITVFEKILCAAVLKDIKKGRLYNLNTLLDRLFGKPKNELSVTGEIDFKSVSIEYVLTNVPGAATQVPGENWQQVEQRIFEPLPDTLSKKDGL